MNKNAKHWIEQLPTYRQGDGALAFSGKYCCLGVACDLAHKTNREEIHISERVSGTSFDGCDTVLPSFVQKWLNLRTDDGVFIITSGVYKLIKQFILERDDEVEIGDVYSLIQLNDDLQVPFNIIAKVIKMEPPGLFDTPSSVHRFNKLYNLISNGRN